MLQTQILDVPEVRLMSDGSGLFSGHDFSYGDYSEETIRQAKDLVKKFGDYIYKNLGYKGIFGLDLIVNKKEGKVYPIECNPRFTDAFPLISEIHSKNGAIPMDVFHILEHMNVPYKIKVDEISKSYEVKTPASQILLQTKTDDWTKVTDDLKAGVYRINQHKVHRKKQENSRSTRDVFSSGVIPFKSGSLPRAFISYLRPGYRFEHLKSADEFLITEGVPFKDTVFKGSARVLRLIFAKSILEKPKTLTEETKEVIGEVYNKLSLQKTEAQILLSDFLGLNVAEIPNDEYLKKAEKLSPDIVNLIGNNTHFGFVRPNKIGWGVNISEADPIKLVRAKKLQKHLKNWLFNMDKYGLSIEIKDPLLSKDYLLWFKKYYDLLSSKEKANIKINPLWLDYKKIMGKNVGGIFLYKGKKLLGGNLFIKDETNITVCYGILEKIKEPNWSLGALTDFLCIKYAKELKYKRIGFGTDNNLYGYHLSTGLLQYKLNLGLIPYWKDTAEIYSTKFINVEKFAGTIAFLGIKEGKNIFYVLNKTEAENNLKLNTDMEMITEELP